MSKNNRIMPLITRSDYFENKNKKSEMESEFEKQLEKSAVQSKERDHNLFDQINSIIGNKRSKYQTVEAAVEDMKKRSGVTDYLKLLAQKEDSGQTKKAQSNDTDEPAIFKKCPAVKTTVENFIKDCFGLLPPQAVIHKVQSIHRGDGCDDSDFLDPAFEKYVSEKIFEEKSSRPSEKIDTNQLGKMRSIDRNDADEAANRDAWHGLMPKTY